VSPQLRVAGLIGVALLTILVVLAANLTSASETLLGTPAAEMQRDAQNARGVCVTPEGWTTYPVQETDDLSDLAAQAGLSRPALLTLNCLEEAPEPGTIIALPPPTPSTAVACGPPQGWTLFEPPKDMGLNTLAQQFGISEENLRQANCLPTSGLILPQAQLYVPLTATPRLVATVTPSPSATETIAAENLTPSIEPTNGTIAP
jgi:hypothetical protein